MDYQSKYSDYTIRFKFQKKFKIKILRQKPISIVHSNKILSLPSKHIQVFKKVIVICCLQLLHVVRLI